MNGGRDIVLTGQIVFPPGDRPRQAARVVARVEDVSQADAPATTIAEHVQEAVALPLGQSESLPFTIRVPPSSMDPQSRYTVRVHVDVTGTASVTRGDFVSTVSYPVSSDQDEIEVAVRRV
jgi:uncharacterized lipoprotein YbaY